MNPSLKALVRRCLPRTIRPRRIWAGPLRGQHLVTSWHDYPAALLGRTERPLLDWFDANVQPGETWLDIGAHYGYTALALSKLVGPAGRVFAFEPMLSTAGYVAQTQRLNQCPHLTVVPVALGATAEQLGLQQLLSVRGMVDRTLDNKPHDQSAEARQTAGSEVSKVNEMSADAERDTWRETILVACLDWLWPRICGAHERIDGVKIDVQGMEIEVLRGMTALLQHHRPKLVVEVHPGVSRAILLDVIEHLGYSRRAIPIEPLAGETEAHYFDDRSYAFDAL